MVWRLQPHKHKSPVPLCFSLYLCLGSAHAQNIWNNHCSNSLVFFTQLLIHKSRSSLPVGSTHFAKCRLPRKTKCSIFFKQERISLLWCPLKRATITKMAETIQQLPYLSWTYQTYCISVPTIPQSPPAQLCTFPTFPTVNALLIRRAWLKDERVEAEIIKVKHRDHTSSQLNWSNIFPPCNRQGFFPTFLTPSSFFLLSISPDLAVQALVLAMYFNLHPSPSDHQTPP